MLFSLDEILDGKVPYRIGKYRELTGRQKVANIKSIRVYKNEKDTANL